MASPAYRDRSGRVNPNWTRKANMARRRGEMATDVVQSIDPLSGPRDCALVYLVSERFTFGKLSRQGI